MRYLNPLRYIHYHTQLAIPTIYDDSLSFYEIMNKTNLHFNEVINDMNENYEIIDKAFQEVLEQTNKWMEEAKAQADRAEQEANKSQASAEEAKNQADRASSEADRAKNEADNSAASAVEAQKQADRASSEADRAHTEAENAKSQAEAAANSAQESASSAAASAGSASESAASATASQNSANASAASATESKNSADASAASATESKNSADASANSASQAAASATASQNSAVASANSASQAAQSATDAANSAKEAADTLDEAKETFVKKAGDTMSGKLTISYGGLSVDGSADISGDFNTGRLQVGTPTKKGNSYLYGNLNLNGILTMSIDGNSALAFSNINEGLKLYAPLKFDGSPQNISNVANPQEALDAVNKQTLDSSVTSINASLSQVNEKITSLTSRMGTAEKNITKNTSDIASLTNRVTTNETSINNINTEITNIKQDITTVEGDYVKKAGDTMSGKLTISYGGLSVDGSADISGDFNTGRLQVGTPTKKGNSYLYGNLNLNGILTMSIDGNSALAFSNINEGLKLYAPLKFDGSPQNISNVANPQEALDAVNKQTLDSSVTSINASLSQVNEKITSLTSRMGTAEKNITKNTSDIASLTNRVTTNETSINNINTEITNIKQDITTVEGDYVKKAGDTMTGNLTMGLNQIVMDTGHIAAGNDTLLFEGYPEIDVDGAKISMVADPVEAMDATNKKYVDDAVANVKPTGDYLPLTGGTMSGDINMGVTNSVRFGAANYALYQNKGTGHLVLTGNSNTDIVEMNNIGTVQFGNETTIKNVKTPTNNKDATPKSYVDGQISIAKNDVQEQMQEYLPLTGGRLSGNLLMGTDARIDFEEGVHLAYTTDFGFGVQTNGGSVGVVSNNIIHTDTTNANSKLITYSISDVSVVPGTTVKQYNCDGTGFQQMRFSGFQNVKFASSLLVDEDPIEAMQVATKQYVDRHAGGGGMVTDLSGDYIFVLTPLIKKYSKFEIFSISKLNLIFNVNGGKEQVQQLSVPYTVFLDNNSKKFIQTNTPFYFIDNFYNNSENCEVALKTYISSAIPNTLYFSFQNMGDSRTSGQYAINAGGKLMDCLVVSQ